MRLIDADKLLGLFDADEDDFWFVPLLELKKRIKEQPTVITAKFGKWIPEWTRGGKQIGKYVKCSLCGKEGFYSETGFTYKSKYCPNCGALMSNAKSDEVTE